MTEDDEVVAVKRTAVIQKRNAGVAVLLIEVHVQILLRPFRGVHHGIVHGCVVDGDPADAVAVLTDKKRNVMARRQNRVFLFLLRIRIFRFAVSIRLRCFFRLIRLLDFRKFRELGEGVDVFLASAVFLPDLNSAEGHDRRQQKGKNRIKMLGIKLRLLHLRPPHRTVRRRCPAFVLRSCSPRNIGRGTA